MSQQEYRPSGFSILPPVVKNLLIINGIFFVATIIFELKLNIDLADILGLHYFFSEDFRPHQIITYMFMHGGLSHIFFNMFALWMFGNMLENVWGAKRFLVFYIVCGIGAALTHSAYTYFTLQPLHDFVNDPTVQGYQHIFNKEILFFIRPEATQAFISEWLKNTADPGFANQAARQINELIAIKASIPVVGASGSVFGLLLAFGMMFPNMMIYIYFLFPIKAKWLVILYGAIELFSGIANVPGDNVAHYAHLGGMLFGFVLIKIWQKGRKQF